MELNQEFGESNRPLTPTGISGDFIVSPETHRKEAVATQAVQATNDEETIAKINSGEATPEEIETFTRRIAFRVSQDYN